jgi:hypothetical protein
MVAVILLDNPLMVIVVAMVVALGGAMDMPSVVMVVVIPHGVHLIRHLVLSWMVMMMLTTTIS